MALQYATEAQKADQSGSRDVAILKYQRAVDVLLKLVSLYPNSPQSRLYLDRANQYRERIKQLKEGLDVSTGSGQGPDTVVVVEESPHVAWDSVIGVEDAKEAIVESIVYPQRRPDLFPLGWPKGILLYGPPGCGKTLLAAAVASEIQAQFYQVDASAIMSKWLGESEKNVAKLFEKARAAAQAGEPVILFIDEADALVGIRNEEVGGEARVRDEFLAQMDGVNDKGKNTPIYVVAATNKPWIFDEPFIRRFEKRIYVPLPDFKSRIELFKLYAKKLRLADDVNLEELARITDGYSGSDIKDICQSVQLKVVKEFFEQKGAAGLTGEPPSGEPRPIAMQDFLEVISKRKPSVSKQMVAFYEKWTAEHAAL
ncbi:MAG: AAA family ATPase [Thermoprotei archaeon]|nr:AAA family ATPase [TACK group archaeon]